MGIQKPWVSQRLDGSTLLAGLPWLLQELGWVLTLSPVGKHVILGVNGPQPFP